MIIATHISIWPGKIDLQLGIFDKSLDQPGTEEISSSPAKLKLSSITKAKQKHQKAEADKHEKHRYLITHN